MDAQGSQMDPKVAENLSIERYTLGAFWGEKWAPARDDNQQIGFEDRYSPWGNPNDKWGRRASPGRETTGVLHGFAVRIQWTTSGTTKLYKKKLPIHRHRAAS